MEQFSAGDRLFVRKQVASYILSKKKNDQMPVNERVMAYGHLLRKLETNSVMKDFKDNNVAYLNDDEGKQGYRVDLKTKKVEEVSLPKN